MQRLVGVLVGVMLVTAGYAAPRSLTIFHTNDIHGHFAPERAAWRKDSALVGGFASLEYYLDSLRRVYPRNIYLDAGDLMTGNPVCNLEYKGVKGGAVQEMLRRVNISAECLGNHEFDLGETHLRQYIGAAGYPLLCANLFDKTKSQPLTAASTVLTVNGLRVGIIGLILDGLKDVVAKSNLTSIEVCDAAKTAQIQINELDPATDLIILLTHLGVDDDSVLATKIHGADVIIGGHSHTRLDEPRRVHGVIIAQTGSYLKNVGVLDLSVDGDTVSAYHGQLIELVYRDRTPRTPLATFADSLEEVIQARYGRVIGELAELWVPGYYNTSNVGNWVCDQMRTRFAADVALVNAGGLRTSWKPGAISMLNVMELSPFENFVTLFDASGNDLLRTAKEQARAVAQHAHGVLEMSGMTITYRRAGDGVEVVEAMIGGKPIDAAKRYRIVSIDYVAISQADRYLNFVPKNPETTNLMLSDLITEEIKNHRGPLRADAEPRLRELP